MSGIKIKDITIEVNTIEEPLTEEEKKKQQALEKEKAERKKISSIWAAIAKAAFILSLLFFILAVLFASLMVDFTSASSICLIVSIISALLSFMVKPYGPADDYGPTWRERYEDRWT